MDYDLTTNLKTNKEMGNKNKPAFSVAIKDNGNPFHKDAMGLTKREYFAAMAMQGFLSNSSIVDIHNDLVADWISRHSIEQADELLKQLELKTGE